MGWEGVGENMHPAGKGQSQELEMRAAESPALLHA